MGVKLQQGKITRCLNTYHELKKVGYIAPSQAIDIQQKIDTAASSCFEAALSFDVETAEDVRELLMFCYSIKRTMFSGKSPVNRALRLALFGKSK